MSYIGPIGYTSNLSRVGSEMSFGKTDERIKKYIEREICYQDQLCIIKHFQGENVWVDKQTPNGRIVQFVIHQTEVIKIFEEYESGFENEKDNKAKQFAAEFTRYRKSKLSS